MLPTIHKGEAEHAPSPLRQEHLGSCHENCFQAVLERSGMLPTIHKGEAEHAPSPLRQEHLGSCHENCFQAVLERTDRTTPHCRVPIHLFAFLSAGSVAKLCVWKRAARRTVCRDGLLCWPR